MLFQESVLTSAVEGSNCMKKNSYESGITQTVKTSFSKYTIYDITRNITGRKTNAVLRWMNENEIFPENVLVIGAYLTGAAIANILVKESAVTVLDINPEIQNLIDPAVSFNESFEEAARGRYDMIIDTSGFGGIDPADLSKLNTPGAFVVENPCSECSDDCLKEINRSEYLLDISNAGKKGILWTSGLNSKTSGTMTLTIEVLRRSMNDATDKDGVLYSAASMEFFERILFKEKNPEKFLRTLNKNALTISSLGGTDCDEIIDLNLRKINSTVRNFRGD
jgi:hypothetical protein